MDESVAGGTYTLLIECTSSVDIEVGALGTRSFDAGWYAYTGSARGPGGFARIDRHRELARGERSTRHWHVDYLLGSDATTIELVGLSAGVDAECAIASAIDGDPVPEFGCSDCGCASHLTYSPQRAPLVDALSRRHHTVGPESGPPG